MLIERLPRWGFTDVPNDRSSHSTPVPRAGGLAVLVGVVVAVSTSSPSSSLLVGVLVATLAGLLGLIDDYRGLSVRARLGCQALISSGAAAGAVANGQAGIIWAASFAILWVAYVNAFNFMDGINAVSCLVAAAAACWYLALGAQSAVPLAAAILGASLAFLWFNGRGLIFLGDVGSYALGSLIWSLALAAHHHGSSIVTSTAPMLLYGVETLVAVLVLVAGGHRLGEAHRFHAYQRLADAGWGHGRVALTVTFVVGLTLLAVRLIDSSVGAAAAAAVIALSYVLVSWVVSAPKAASTMDVDST